MTFATTFGPSWRPGRNAPQDPRARGLEGEALATLRAGTERARPR